MRRQRKYLILLFICMFTLSAVFAVADVKQKSTTKMDFKGVLGTVMKLFGAERPQHTVTYVKGNLMRTDRLDKKGKKVEETDIVDLDRELFIHIRHKKKKYSQMTFAEWREMIETGLQGLTMPRDEDQGEKSQPETEVKWDFNFDVETPGEKETIAGYEAEKVILKLNVEAEVTEKAGADQPEQKAAGGLKVTSTHMVAKDVAGMDELREFNLKLAEKLGLNVGETGLAGVLSQVMQSNEQLAAAMEKMREEGEKLDGVPLRVHTVFETWGQQQTDMKKDPQQDVKIPTSVGGLFKKFGKKKKKPDAPNVLLEITTELKMFETTSLSEDLFKVPAKYKLVKTEK